MEVVEEFTDVSIDELVEGEQRFHPPLNPLKHLSAAELPENSPRYVVLSYELKHPDGRKSFPLVLINWIPSSSEMSLKTLHASALINFQTTVSDCSSIRIALIDG